MANNIATSHNDKDCKGRNYDRITTQKIIYEPHDNDILFGRGNSINNHVGNGILRSFAAKKRDTYKDAFFREQKNEIAKEILNQIQSLNPPGRFLMPVKGDLSEWIEVEEEKSILKICQVLREKKQAKTSEEQPMMEDITSMGPPSGKALSCPTSKVELRLQKEHQYNSLSNEPKVTSNVHFDATSNPYFINNLNYAYGFPLLNNSNTIASCPVNEVESCLHKEYETNPSINETKVVSNINFGATFNRYFINNLPYLHGFPLLNSFNKNARAFSAQQYLGPLNAVRSNIPTINQTFSHSCNESSIPKPDVRQGGIVDKKQYKLNAIATKENNEIPQSHRRRHWLETNRAKHNPLNKKKQWGRSVSGVFFKDSESALHSKPFKAPNTDGKANQESGGNHVDLFNNVSYSPITTTQTSTKGRNKEVEFKKRHMESTEPESNKILKNSYHHGAVGSLSSIVQSPVSSPTSSVRSKYA